MLVPYLWQLGLPPKVGTVLQVRLPPAAQDLMEQLLCDVDDRLGSHGTEQLKVRQQLSETLCLVLCIVPMLQIMPSCTRLRLGLAATQSKK